jgi:hypothetical protein
MRNAIEVKNERPLGGTAHFLGLTLRNGRAANAKEPAKAAATYPRPPGEQTASYVAGCNAAALLEMPSDATFGWMLVPSINSSRPQRFKV